MSADTCIYMYYVYICCLIQELFNVMQECISLLYYYCIRLLHALEENACSEEEPDEGNNCMCSHNLLTE